MDITDSVVPAGTRELLQKPADILREVRQTRADILAVGKLGHKAAAQDWSNTTYPDYPGVPGLETEGCDRDDEDLPRENYRARTGESSKTVVEQRTLLVGSASTELRLEVLCHREISVPLYAQTAAPR